MGENPHSPTKGGTKMPPLRLNRQLMTGEVDRFLDAARDHLSTFQIDFNFLSDIEILVDGGDNDVFIRI
jgi:hypothetical protein